MQARVKNRRVSAVGGWKFFQPQTGAHFEDWDFGSICQKIQAHRQGNPRFSLSTNLADIENEVDETNALRMLSIPGADSYVETIASTVPKWRPPSSPSSPSVAVASERILGGAKIALEMFGAQGPLKDSPLPSQRAAICAVCPKNEKGDWTRWFTVPASFIIRQMIETVYDLKLTTDYDDKIHFCTACSCPLKTKVHARLSHIKAHTPQEAMDQLHPRCWILHET